MISFRYHLVSLISVFLAIALGIVIGTTQLNGAVLDGLATQVDNLTDDKRELETRSQTLQSQLAEGDAFGEAVAPVLVADKLPGATVLVVLAAEDIDADVVDQTTALVEAAGATVAGTLQLLPEYGDPQVAQDLQNYATSEGVPPGIQLPVTDDAGILVGALLGTVLMNPTEGLEPVDPTATTTVLAALSSLGVLSVESPEVAGADYAIILTVDALDGDDAVERNTTLAELAEALDTAGRGAVVAGDALSAGETGLVGAIRADPTGAAAVSTVDNVNVAAGRVSTVLALSAEGQGTSGKYGTGEDTQPVPPLDQ
ncbi:MAG: copper transporter [Geodermatophilaceae bacterium]|nr:copper transporter [Geodermatophilaceae bacterium]